jgi:exopolysaccharide/PEP-CTERM locus tyrosine autokinase
MSVIENTLNRLRQRAAAGPAAPGGSSAYGAVGATGAAARRLSTESAPLPERVIAIDQDGLRAAGMLPPAHQEHELAQEYRRIKRPLINSALGRGVAALPEGNLIMLTSAVPGEGKTFMSLNLAFSICREEDVTVLLVDGDVVNPRISQILGAENEPGLLDLIKDPTISLAAAIVPTDVPGLAFLPAGRQDANATELLASARMHAVMAQLGSTDPARLVLFDSAPLLVTTESQALAHFAGQVLVVVRADRTQQHVLLEALETLDEGKLVSLVLNQSLRQPGNYYQYGVSAKPREQARDS